MNEDTETKQKIFELLIDEIPLTTKALKDIGISKYKINKLLANNIIKREKRGLYVLTDISLLSNYGKDLMEKKQVERAIKCIKRAFELDNKQLGACFNLFVQSVRNKEYTESINFLRHLLKSNQNQLYTVDNNLYLLLLSNITEIPEDLIPYVKSIKLKDILLSKDDKRYSQISNDYFRNIDIYEQNGARIAALNGNFELAHKKAKTRLGLLSRFNTQETMHELVIRHLYNQARQKLKQQKADIVKLIKENQFEQVKDILKGNARQRYLSDEELLILKLAEENIEINNGKKVLPPKRFSQNITKLSKAIETHNYEQALSIVIDENKKNNIENETSPIYIMLKKIINASLLEKSEQLSTSKVVIDTASLDKDLLGIEDLTIGCIDCRQKVLTLLEKCSEKFDKEQGIVLIRSINKDMISELQMAAENYRNLIVINLSDNDNTIIAIKSHSRYFNQMDIKSQIRRGEEQYKKEDYIGSLNTFMELLHNVKEVGPYIYYRIGLALIKLGDRKTAIKYLIVNDKLNKQDVDPKKNGRDIEPWIKSLIEEEYSIEKIATDESQKESDNTPETDKKKTNETEQPDISNSENIAQTPDVEPSVVESPQETPTINDLDNVLQDDETYGIDLEKVIFYLNYIGLDVITTCQQLNMSEEDTTIAILLLAREYYCEGEPEPGNKNLELAKCRKQTPKVQSLIRIIESKAEEYLANAAKNKGKIKKRLPESDN